MLVVTVSGLCLQRPVVVAGAHWGHGDPFEASVEYRSWKDENRGQPGRGRTDHQGQWTEEEPGHCLEVTWFTLRLVYWQCWPVPFLSRRHVYTLEPVSCICKMMEGFADERKRRILWAETRSYDTSKCWTFLLTVSDLPMYTCGKHLSRMGQYVRLVLFLKVFTKAKNRI